jgi:integrase
MARNPNRSLELQDAKIVTSRDGYVFDPAAFHWKLSRDRTISLQWVDGALSVTLAASFIKVLTHYAVLYSADHAGNMCDRFRTFALWMRNQKFGDRVTSGALISYRHTLDRKNEWYLGSISGFLATWVELGLPGVDDDVASLLDGWTLRGNIKGAAVQTQCPLMGALSDLEYEALQLRLLDGFELREVGLADFVLVTLFSGTGRRPSQLGDLKGGDLIEASSSDGLREFLLNVPRRKVRGGGWRVEFKAVALTPEIGSALSALIAENEAKLRTLCEGVGSDLLKLLPIFPAWNVVRDAIQDGSNALRQMLATDRAHVTTRAIRSRLERTVTALSVLSERTGKPIRVFPLRMRRTLGTRAAREGYGPLIIAELLDHSDTQNACVYTENVPEHVDAINEAVARQIAPRAQAFAGVLVRDEGEALRGSDPTSRVRTGGGGVAGTCGHFGFCGALAPIACYTCRHFQAWLDGPHDEVLQGLLIERERIQGITQDKGIAAINDRTIFAVTQVIQVCEARQTEMDRGIPCQKSFISYRGWN